MKVTLEVKAVQIKGKQTEETMQQTKAILEEKENGYQLFYLEEDKTRSQIEVIEQKVILTKKAYQLVFEEGKQDKTDYITSYGKIPMQIQTKRVEIHPNPKQVYLFYELEILGTTYQNEIQIKIKQE